MYLVTNLEAPYNTSEEFKEMDDALEEAIELSRKGRVQGIWIKENSELVGIALRGNWYFVKDYELLGGNEETSNTSKQG
jgi:hypothetical protein